MKVNIFMIDPINFNVYHPEPILIVISGPSGAGKDAVLKEMQKRQLPFHFVVTVTDREKRKGEVDGVDYFFVSTQEFKNLISSKALIEYALVYGQFKGIPKAQVDEALASGKDVVLRIDVQGAAKVRELYPDCILIFLVPDDYQKWYDRLVARKTETVDTLRLRVKTAREEMGRLSEFDYMVVNPHDRLEDAVDRIESIIDAEHHRVQARKIQG
jgi:guanylate kinase